MKSGVRLDAAVLYAFPTTSRSFVRDSIESGAVEIAVEGENKRVVSNKGLKLRGGETIWVRELAEAQDNVVKAEGVCPKPVYEDEALLAFDKPCGMPVQPLSRTEIGTLMNAVVTKYPECIALGDRPLMAGALHRIDADTSGLVLVARSAAAFENLRAQFTAQTVKKTYLALVEGLVAVGGRLENELIHDPTLPFCRMIDRNHNRLTLAERNNAKAMRAVTEYRPIGNVTVENEERTLMEVTIYTGVTHQIRAQLSIAGMHIVNDRLYGGFAIENQTGHCLHAYQAEFTHPVSGEMVKLKTELPSWARIG